MRGRVALVALFGIVAGAALLWLTPPDGTGGTESGEREGVSGEAAPRRLRARAIASFPHDPEAFTQGLVWHAGELYESTGEYGRSTLRRVEIAGGRVLQRTDLTADLFGEGLARVSERLVQLTWRSQEALIYDLKSFEEVGRRLYRGEGWGLCFDGARLVRSDGSAELIFHDPRTLREAGRVTVTKEGLPVRFLNELECVDDSVYANVWQTDQIVRIDPGTGRVDAVIDASGLLTLDERAAAGVLNGIAFNQESRTFYLTGKRWPRLFEVVLEETPADPPGR